MSNVENKELQPKDKNERVDRSKRPFNWYWIYGVIVLAIMAMWLFGNNGHLVQIDVGQYRQFLNDGDVQRISIVPHDAVQVPWLSS